MGLIRFIDSMKNFFKFIGEDRVNHRKRFIFRWSLLPIFMWILGNRFQHLDMASKHTKIYYDPFNCWIFIFLRPQFTFIIMLLSILGWYFVNNFINYYIKYNSRKIESRPQAFSAVERSLNQQPYGTADWLNSYPEEIENSFEVSDNPKKIYGPIMGSFTFEGKEYLAALRYNLMYKNNNVIYIGVPGAGKTTAILLSQVYNCIARGESVVAIDTKGDVYKDSGYVAEKAGYDVFLFDVKSDEFINSDGCDLLQGIDIKTIKGRQLAPIVAGGIAKTFINQFLGSQKKDIYYNVGVELLKAFILITMDDKEIWRDHRPTLADVYDKILQYGNPKAFAMEYGRLASPAYAEHLAHESVGNFMNKNDPLKDAAFGNLSTYLECLQSSVVRKVVSTNDIKFKEIGQKPTIVYIIIPDTEETPPLAAVFIQSMFKELVDYADTKEVKADAKINGRKETLPVPVNVIIDEAYQVGPIPMMVNKEASVRSRGIRITQFFQDNNQIEALYPNKEFNSIIGNCSYQVIMQINDNATAKTWSETLGTYTGVVNNTMQNKLLSEYYDVKDETRTSKGLARVELMTVSQIRGHGEYGLGDDELIVNTQARKPLRLKKWGYWNHPIYKYLHLDEEKNMRYAADHIPSWHSDFFKSDSFASDDDDNDDNDSNAKPEKKTSKAKKADAKKTLNEINIEESDEEYDEETIKKKEAALQKKNGRPGSRRRSSKSL